MQEEHILTVGVKDRITPTKSDYARVIINVRDYNDHAPQFLATQYNGTITETATIGTTVAEVIAIDRDKGANGHIMYSIVSGKRIIYQSRYFLLNSNIVYVSCVKLIACFLCIS